jgi:TIGR03009 family protein
MRHYSLALLGVLAMAAGAFTQQAAPKPTTTGTPEQLNEHLARWEREMKGVNSLSAECRRTDVNRVRNDKVELGGVVKCLKVEAGGKVDKLALLQLGPKDNPAAFTEKYICTGALLYRFAPSTKTIWVHKLRGGVADDNFLDFLFQFKAETMKKRYDITLVFPNSQDDANYIYFDIKPRQDADKAEFQRARLVLYKKNYLPAQLWFEEPTGNHHTWELRNVTPNDTAVKPAEFVAPEKPNGWEMKEAKDTETESRPRVVRPSGQ